MKTKDELIQAHNALVAWLNSQDISQADAIALMGFSLSEFMGELPKEVRTQIFCQFILLLERTSQVKLDLKG